MMNRLIGQGEAGQIIFAEAEESESMTGQLRCTCGFAEKIEGALKRIRGRGFRARNLQGLFSLLCKL